MNLLPLPPKPVPPEHLMKRVNGAAGPAFFEKVGQDISLEMVEAVPEIIARQVDANILDFGCGCGRIIRHFREFLPGAQVFGTDIDRETIAWCQGNLGAFGRFFTNATEPPLFFPDNFFDFVFSISVFTHLPEDMEQSWLAELSRVTKPGAPLLLSTHGESLLAPPVPDEMLRETLVQGFYYRVGAGTDGLPSFYQTSYHTQSYIEERWSPHFTIEKFVPQGIARRQDLVLCRKPLA